MPWCLRGLQKTNSDYEGRHEDLKTFVLKPLCLRVFVVNPNSTGITRCLVLRQDGRRSVRLGLEKGQRAGFRNGRGPNARGAGIGRKVIRMGIGDLELGGDTSHKELHKVSLTPKCPMKNSAQLGHELYKRFGHTVIDSDRSLEWRLQERQSRIRFLFMFTRARLGHLKLFNC